MPQISGSLVGYCKLLLIKIGLSFFRYLSQNLTPISVHSLGQVVEAIFSKSNCTKTQKVTEKKKVIETKAHLKGLARNNGMDNTVQYYRGSKETPNHRRM